MEQIYNLLQSKEIHNLQLARQLAVGQKISFDYQKFMKCFPQHMPIGHPLADDTKIYCINFRVEFITLIRLDRKYKPVLTATVGLLYDPILDKTFVKYRKKQKVLGTVYTEDFKPVYFKDVVSKATPIWETVFFDQQKTLNNLLDKVHPNAFEYKCELWREGVEEGSQSIWKEILSPQVKLSSILPKEQLDKMEERFKYKITFEKDFEYKNKKCTIEGININNSKIGTDVVNDYIVIMFQRNPANCLDNPKNPFLKEYLVINPKIAIERK